MKKKPTKVNSLQATQTSSAVNFKFPGGFKVERRVRDESKRRRRTNHQTRLAGFASRRRRASRKRRENEKEGKEEETKTRKRQGIKCGSRRFLFSPRRQYASSSFAFDGHSFFSFWYSKEAFCGRRFLSVSVTLLETAVFQSEQRIITASRIGQRPTADLVQIIPQGS